MAVQTIVSVALTQPVADPAIDEGGNFTMGLQPTMTGMGGMSWDAVFQWDQGLGDSEGNYATIPSGAGGLYHSATNPIVNLTAALEQTLTINSSTAGTYYIRAYAIDHNGGEATFSSASQVVTVSAGSGFQPAWAGPNSRLGV